MPRTKTIEVYTIQELEGRARERAFDTLREWTTDHAWWDCVYNDAATVGLRICGFDVYRGTIEIEFKSDANDTAQLIMENHGASCDTYKLAQTFINDRAGLIADNDCEIEDVPEYETLCEKFLRDIGLQYLVRLRIELEHLESEEYLTDHAAINGYEFTVDGKVA